MSNNGKGEITPKMLTDSEKLDVLLDAFSEFSEKQERTEEKMDEIIEKLDNVSRPGGSFGEEDFE